MVEFFKKLFRALFGKQEKPGTDEFSKPDQPVPPEDTAPAITEEAAEPVVPSKPAPKPDPKPTPKPKPDPVPDPKPKPKPDPAPPADPVTRPETNNSGTAGSAGPEIRAEANIEVAPVSGSLTIDIHRYSEGSKDILGKLYLDGKFQCYTLEHPLTGPEKALPAGKYALTLRTAGGKHTTYYYRFRNMHKGLLGIKDQPGFEFAHLHIGNQEPDQAGSIIVGLQVIKEADTHTSREVWYSDQAYKNIYPAIADALAGGKQVVLRIEAA